MLKKSLAILSQQSVFFWIGILFLLIFIFYKAHLAIRLSFAQAPTPVAIEATSSASAIPIQIIIDEIKLDLPIYPTTIQNNTWQIDDRGISYLAASARPGNKGSIILYGHNTNNRFGPIRWLEKEKEIKLTTSDNQTHHYTVSEVLTVDPSQVDVLNSDDETLILYTCTGIFDRQRFIIKATPKK